MIYVGVDLVKSSRSVMDSTEIVEVLKGVVLEPSINGAIGLGIFSFVGEVVAFLPSSALFAGQAFLLKDPPTFSFFVKLVIFVTLPIGIGTTLGSYLTYGVAYYGGKPAIDKLQKYLRFSWQSIEKLEKRFKSKWYDEILFLGIRSIPFMPTIPLNILAGVFRMDLYKYTLLSIIGITLKMTIIFGAVIGGGVGIINILNL